jgi:cAMP-dependent protein kinase regulator
MSSDLTNLLDQAWDALLDERTEEGLRIAVSLLTADPAQLGAASLVLHALGDLGQPDATEKHAKALVNAWVRRGDLPQAVAVAHLASGKQKTELLASIAAAFGKGSKRLGDIAPQPPPLPIEVSEEKASGKALIDRANAALTSFAAWKDPLPDGQVPALPLFSALAPKALERLLAVMTLREFKSTAVVIEQGGEGKEAFVVARGMLRVERAGSNDDLTTLALLGPGAIFGEMALVSDSPRAAAVRAQEPTRLLAMSRKDLEALAKTEPAVGEELAGFCRARMIANLVRTSTILRAAPIAQREDLMSRFTAHHFAAGEALVHEGSEAAALFLIASGAVRVMKDEEGEALMLAELGPGEVVGEIGIVLRRPASATVLATHPTVALELTREAFDDAIKSHPSLLGELYQLATAREEETRSIVAQDVMDLDADVLL